MSLEKNHQCLLSEYRKTNASFRLQDNRFEFPTRKHKFIWVFCIENPVLKAFFEKFVTLISNKNQIWYSKGAKYD